MRFASMAFTVKVSSGLLTTMCHEPRYTDVVA